VVAEGWCGRQEEGAGPVRGMGRGLAGERSTEKVLGQDCGGGSARRGVEAGAPLIRNRTCQNILGDMDTARELSLNRLSYIGNLATSSYITKISW
jgi:hypothetical protein